jgi:NAD(P)-dependent dehydrogenase (short-subunit alcohol dehydrogenase family)
MRHGKVMLAIVLALAALGADATAQSGHVLRLSSPVSKDHAFGRGAEKFKQLVADATRGHVDVQVHHANALGGIREGLEMVRLGSLDFQVCGVAHVSRFVPEMNALILPYLWKDGETMFGALDGRMGQILKPLLIDKGFKVAGWWDNGFRHVSNSKRPVRSPEGSPRVDSNLKGMFLCCKHVIPHMLKAGGGRIINFSSNAGRTSSPALGVHYTAAKAGVLGLTRHLAKEYAPHRSW